MWWLVGIGIYVLFLATVLAFLRGASSRECPLPEQPLADIQLMFRAQPEPEVQVMAFAPRHRSIWETDTSYSPAP
jgi:hypothetical protein